MISNPEHQAMAERLACILSSCARAGDARRGLSDAYRRLLPDHWNGFQVVRTPSAVSSRIRSFWEERPYAAGTPELQAGPTRIPSSRTPSARPC